MGFLNRYRELPHADTTLEHIAENLRYLFGARRGNGGPLHRFGIGQPDTHADATGATRQLLTELLNDIHRYERRIEWPVLQTEGRTEDLCLRIRLTGTVEGKRVRFALRYSPIYGGIEVEVAHAE